MAAEPVDLFWRHVAKTDGCWNWTAAINHNGYGKFNKGRQMIRAHRYAYELLRGAIPAGLLILHHCDNRRCVNPDHLFTGTARDNARDMLAKGRARSNPLRGAKHPNARLTDADVRAIRARVALGEPIRQLGRAYGVSRTLIANIKARRAWAHVP